MMLRRIALAAILWPLVSGLSLSPLTTPGRRNGEPSQNKQRLSQAVVAGSVGLALWTTALLPRPAQAATEVVKIDADIPALIQIAKDNKDTILQLAKQASSAVSITKLPSNWVEFARDAAAGDVYVEINGLPLDISLLSDKGIIDVDVSTSQGDVSLTLSSKLIPKLPFFPKRPAMIQSTTTAESVESKAPAGVSKSRAERSVVVPTAEETVVEPFSWNGWSLEQILGTTALSLGGVYGASYAYYIKSGEEEERAAQEKRNAKKKAPPATAAAPAPVPAEADIPSPAPPKAGTVKQPPKVKEAEPEKPKSEGIAQTTMSGSNFTSMPTLPTEEPKKSSWKFWKQ